MMFPKDITLGQYYPVDSVVHRLDPRSKLLSSLLLMSLLLMTDRLVMLLVFVLLLLLGLKLAKLPLRLAWRSLRPFLWLFLLTFILHLIYTQGRILFKIPILGWNITQEGLQRGVLYTSRIVLLIIMASLFTATTSPMELTDAIGRIASPLRKLKVPVPELAMMMTIALRFIPILLEEADRIKKAQLSRGARFEGGVLQRVRGVIPLIMPLFLSAFKKADDLAVAMEARCYRVGEERTSFKELKFKPQDYALILCSLGAFGILVL